MSVVLVAGLQRHVVKDNISLQTLIRQGNEQRSVLFSSMLQVCMYMYIYVNSETVFMVRYMVLQCTVTVYVLDCLVDLKSCSRTANTYRRIADVTTLRTCTHALRSSDTISSDTLTLSHCSC